VPRSRWCWGTQGIWRSLAGEFQIALAAPSRSRLRVHGGCGRPRDGGAGRRQLRPVLPLHDHRRTSPLVAAATVPIWNASFGHQPETERSVVRFAFRPQRLPSSARRQRRRRRRGRKQRRQRQHPEIRCRLSGHSSRRPQTCSRRKRRFFVDVDRYHPICGSLVHALLTRYGFIVYPAATCRGPCRGPYHPACGFFDRPASTLF